MHCARALSLTECLLSWQGHSCWRKKELYVGRMAQYWGWHKNRLAPLSHPPHSQRLDRGWGRFYNEWWEQHTQCYSLCPSWATTSLQLWEKDEQRERVCVWVGLSSNGVIIGAFFFEQNVNGQAYLQMINEEVVPQMEIHFQRQQNWNVPLGVVGSRWCAKPSSHRCSNRLKNSFTNA